MSSYAYVSLSLIGLCALAGAGVGVGSGVAMMYQQMAQAEQEQKSTGAVAHSPGMCILITFTTLPGRLVFGAQILALSLTNLVSVCSREKDHSLSPWLCCLWCQEPVSSKKLTQPHMALV